MGAGPDTVALAKLLIAENKRPTKAQERQIREAIPRLQENVRKIEADFNEVDISLAIIPPEQKPDASLAERFNVLKVQLNSAQEMLAAHMRSLTFTREVPVEVLELIFDFCLPSDYVRPDARQAPLLLCQICSAWRKVTIATPRLWSSLALNLRRRPGAWRDFLTTWLGRAGDTPLSISFTGTDNSYYFNEHVMRMLRPSARRWRRVRVDVPPSALAKLMNTPLPLLESIEVRTQTSAVGALYLPAEDAPRLRRVVLLDAGTSPTSMYLPWDQLIELHSPKHALDPDGCFALLTKCPNLARCTIHLSPLSPTHLSDAHRPLKMPRLRRLVLIGGIGRDNIKTFWTQVALPSLESLELVNLYESESFGLGEESSLAVLARNSNLISLTLLGGNHKDGLFKMVVAIPSLREVLVGDARGGVKRTPKEVKKALDIRGSAG